MTKLKKKIKPGPLQQKQTDAQAYDAFVYAGYADQINRLARAISARDRLKERATPKPVPTPGDIILTKDEIRRVLTEHEVHVGAGKDKSKENRITALTLVEMLYNAGLINMSTLCAADRFREMHLEREGRSEGVGGYGNNPGQADPSRKSDRHGRALTGLEVGHNGKVQPYEGPRRSNGYAYEAAKLAMCGVIDAEGERVFDEQLVSIMIASITNTTNIQTQTAIAKKRTKYEGEKQLPSAGATVITEALKRLALHLRYGG